MEAALQVLCGRLAKLHIQLDMLQGDRLVYGRCSYTAQTAWIQNATVRENILMGRAYDAALYDAVIAACALQSDFDLLAAGVSSVVHFPSHLKYFRNEKGNPLTILFYGKQGKYHKFNTTKQTRLEPIFQTQLSSRESRDHECLQKRAKTVRVHVR